MTTATGELQYFDVAAAASQRDTIASKIRGLAERQPDELAMVSSGFRPLSYRELQLQILRIRSALRLAGLDKNSRIAIALPNGPQAALAIVAVSCSAVCIPVNPRQTLPELERSFAALRPDAIVMLKDEESAARRAAETHSIRILEAIPSPAGTPDIAIAGYESDTIATHDESDEPGPEAHAFILQTSGTSAEPKLIPTRHRNMLAAAARVQVWFNLTPHDRCLSVSPVFYAHGLHVTVFAPLLCGGTVAFPSDISKFDYAEWFTDLRPTWYSGGPTLHRLIFDNTKLRDDAKGGHSLRFIVSGGAPLPPDIFIGLQRTFGVPVLEHYGSSEGLQICANQLPPGRAKSGTCGAPWPNTIMIVGEDGQRLAAGQKGEVLVGGPTVVSGYLNAPELTKQCFVDGWFKSGDIGSIDGDGFLTLHGRKSDLINRGGEKISPSEVDEALMRHPAVAEAAVFPVPHPRLGEDIAAAVVLRPGVTATPIELRQFLHEQVAAFKVPRRIFIRDQLPKGATGKVLRHQLSESPGESATDERPAAPAPADGTSVDPALVSDLLGLWKRLLKVERLSIDDDFVEKGGDSLLAMEMLANLESLTGLTIPNSILFEASTIRELAHKLSERDDLRPKHVVQMHAGGDRTPLIYFHGHFLGLGHSALRLGNLLGPSQPVSIVVPHGAGDEPIPGSIEAMAAERLPSILASQPHGPYRIGGNCLGGLVAFEVARLLIAAGEKVEVVVMLDTPTINSYKSVQVLLSTLRGVLGLSGPFGERAMALTWFRCANLQKFWNYSWSRRWSAAGWRVAKLLGGTKRPDSAVTDDDPAGKETSSLEKFNDPRMMRYLAAMSNYVPRPLAVRVLYFKVDYGIGAWRRLSPDIEVVSVPGNHDFPDLGVIAESLRTRLKVADGISEGSAI